ncbi:hypothetical protein OCU04_004740 [Sclerotinia nivalis]|uniref:Uncharacterized protein n=1 Tax=Sclerotinia nivalis TaxID=352851 RepID=A0A9X0ARV1_9HELO|nr:hypothetical protein OCU04_004740 [Sclerotinia nivalis]
MPPFLSACKSAKNPEMRLRFYKLCFAAQPSQARIYFNVDYDAIRLLIPRSMRMSTYFGLFSMANATVKDDIKVVFMENGWELADKASPMPLLGPDCRVFLFQKRCNMLGVLSSFRQVDSMVHWYVREIPSFQVIFGTSKVTDIFGYNKPEGVANPNPLLIKEDWTTGFHGLGGIARQYVESLLP